MGIGYVIGFFITGYVLITNEYHTDALEILPMAMTGSSLGGVVLSIITTLTPLFH